MSNVVVYALLVRASVSLLEFLSISVFQHMN